MDGLAESPEVQAVVLVDPTTFWANEAATRLRTKLTGCHTNFRDAVAAEGEPSVVVVAMEAVLAPPIIKQALVHCDVLAEKPACTRCAAIISEFFPAMFCAVISSHVVCHGC